MASGLSSPPRKVVIDDVEYPQKVAGDRPKGLLARYKNPCSACNTWGHRAGMIACPLKDAAGEVAAPLQGVVDQVLGQEDTPAPAVAPPAPPSSEKLRSMSTAEIADAAMRMTIPTTDARAELVRRMIEAEAGERAMLKDVIAVLPEHSAQRKDSEFGHSKQEKGIGPLSSLYHACHRNACTVTHTRGSSTSVALQYDPLTGATKADVPRTKDIESYHLLNMCIEDFRHTSVQRNLLSEIEAHALVSTVAFRLYAKLSVVVAHRAITELLQYADGDIHGDDLGSLIDRKFDSIIAQQTALYTPAPKVPWTPRPGKTPQQQGRLQVPADWDKSLCYCFNVGKSKCAVIDKVTGECKLQHKCGFKLPDGSVCMQDHPMAGNH